MNKMKDRDYIEKLISEKIEELDIADPAEGHLERFRKRLELQHKAKSFNWKMVWRVAAAVVFIFLAVNQARIWISPKEPKPVGLASVSQEYAEVEFYYTSAISSGLDNLKSMADAGLISMEENIVIQQEFREFENRYESLQQEFIAHPSDDRVINAMIEYYQTKLSVINMIISKLQDVKQKNRESHETEI